MVVFQTFLLKPFTYLKSIYLREIEVALMMHVLECQGVWYPVVLLRLEAISESKYFLCFGALILWLFCDTSAPAIPAPAQLCGIRRK